MIFISRRKLRITVSSSKTYIIRYFPGCLFIRQPVLCYRKVTHKPFTFDVLAFGDKLHECFIEKTGKSKKEDACTRKMLYTNA